jgi:hypothetical protein
MNMNLALKKSTEEEMKRKPVTEDWDDRSSNIQQKERHWYTWSQKQRRQNA